jgi:hypothetical protein
MTTDEQLKITSLIASSTSLAATAGRATTDSTFLAGGLVLVALTQLEPLDPRTGPTRATYRDVRARLAAVEVVYREPTSRNEEGPATLVAALLRFLCSALKWPAERVHVRGAALTHAPAPASRG